MDESINKAKTKMLAERHMLLIIILKGRRRENRKPRVCNCFIITKNFQVSFYVNMGTCNLIRFHLYATFIYPSLPIYKLRISNFNDFCARK